MSILALSPQPEDVKPPLLPPVINGAAEVGQTLVSTGTNTQQAQGEIAQDIVNITNSLANNSLATQFAHGGSLSVIGGFIIHIAVEWKNRSESDNIIRVVFVGVLILLASLYKGLSWHKEKNSLLLQTAEKNKQEVEKLIQFKAVLEEFYKMACICASPDPSNNLPSLFGDFLSGINGLPANIVPNFLSSRWKGVEPIIAKPCGAARQQELANYMTILMLPYIKYYAGQIDRKLTEIGYALPAGDQQNLEVMENIGGILPQPPSNFIASGSGPSSNEKEEEVEV